MTTLRDFRAYAHPLLLVAVWSTLDAATIAWIALVPGEPFYSDSGAGSLGQAIFFSTAVVLFVVVRSRVAWWIAIFFAWLGICLGVAHSVFEPGVKPLGVAMLQAAALWLLRSRNMELYVQSRRRRLADLRPAR